jgi:hypothetical protein
MNVEDIFTSIGASSGLFLVYKVATKIYYRYYVDSACHNVDKDTTKIEITITKDEHDHHQEKEEKKDDINKNDS